MNPDVYYKFDFCRFFRSAGNRRSKIRHLQTLEAPIRDAEANALDLAKELNTEISMSWKDPISGDWHVFGKYFPNETRRLHGEAQLQSFDEKQQVWFNVDADDEKKGVRNEK